MQDMKKWFGRWDASDLFHDVFVKFLHQWDVSTMPLYHKWEENVDALISHIILHTLHQTTKPSTMYANLSAMHILKFMNWSTILHYNDSPLVTDMFAFSTKLSSRHNAQLSITTTFVIKILETSSLAIVTKTHTYYVHGKRQVKVLVKTREPNEGRVKIMKWKLQSNNRSRQGSHDNGLELWFGPAYVHTYTYVLTYTYIYAYTYVYIYTHIVVVGHRA